MYCVIKCVKTKRVLKRKFASSVFHNCNAKTQICVTGRQSVKWDTNSGLLLAYLNCLLMPLVIHDHPVYICDTRVLHQDR
jgi:hypothetical protein